MKTTTKDSIAQAFLEVCAQKPVDKVTVKDVADVIGISRQTFYYHFQDIVDVVEYWMEKDLTHLLERTLEVRDHKEALEIIFSYEPQNASIYHKVVHSRYREEVEHLFLVHVKKYLRQLVDFSPVRDVLGEEELEVALSFYAWAVIGVMLDHQSKPGADNKKLAQQVSYLIQGKLFDLRAAEGSVG